MERRGTPALPTSCPAGRPLPQLPLQRPPGPRRLGGGAGAACFGGAVGTLLSVPELGLSSAQGATGERGRQVHSYPNVRSHYQSPAPIPNKAQRGCHSPKSHSVLTAGTPRSRRRPPHTHTLYLPMFRSCLGLCVPQAGPSPFLSLGSLSRCESSSPQTFIQNLLYASARCYCLWSRV